MEMYRKRRGSRGDVMVVYVLHDPRNGRARYVGITNSPIGRLSEHMRMYGGNESKNAWIQELLDAYMLPLMYTLEIVEDADRARDREIAWIKYFLSHGADLLNDEVSRIEEKSKIERIMRVRRRLKNHHAHRNSRKWLIPEAAQEGA
jgi:predicted GIY-YIG superfamily endonuclease